MYMYVYIYIYMYMYIREGPHGAAAGVPGQLRRALGGGAGGILQGGSEKTTAKTIICYVC